MNIYVVMTREPDSRLIASYTMPGDAERHAAEGITHEDHPTRRVRLYVEEVPLNPVRERAHLEVYR